MGEPTSMEPEETQPVETSDLMAKLSLRDAVHSDDSKCGPFLVAFRVLF